jgi:hypothetical protein
MSSEKKRTYQVRNDDTGQIEEREYISPPPGQHGDKCGCYVCRHGEIRRTR